MRTYTANIQLIPEDSSGGYRSFKVTLDRSDGESSVPDYAEVQARITQFHRQSAKDQSLTNFLADYRKDGKDTDAKSALERAYEIYTSIESSFKANSVASEAAESEDQGGEQIEREDRANVTTAVDEDTTTAGGKTAVPTH